MSQRKNQESMSINLKDNKDLTYDINRILFRIMQQTSSLYPDTKMPKMNTFQK